MRATSDPSAFIAYISEFPSLSDTNAMRPSSGAGVCAATGDAPAQNAMAATNIASAARWILTGLFPRVRFPN